MKTFLIYAEMKTDDHAGEQYDEIFEVENVPTTLTIQKWAERIKSKIRTLWNEDRNSENQCVQIHVDAATAFGAIVRNLQVILKADENIEIDLPGLGKINPKSQDVKTLIGEEENA